MLPRQEQRRQRLAGNRSSAAAMASAASRAIKLGKAPLLPPWSGWAESIRERHRPAYCGFRQSPEGAKEWRATRTSQFPIRLRSPARQPAALLNARARQRRADQSGVGHARPRRLEDDERLRARQAGRQLKSVFEIIISQDKMRPFFLKAQSPHEASLSPSSRRIARLPPSARLRWCCGIR